MQASAADTSKLPEFDRVRIIGQGLTGSLLALILNERDVPFVVQDTHLPGSATEVAPGIVNPLAGRNFRPPDSIGELLKTVESGMALIERTLGESIWKPTPILRMFAEPTQIDRFTRGMEKFGIEAFVDERFPENTFAHLNDVFGSFLTKGGGWADLPRLKSLVRDWLKAGDRLIEEPWDHSAATGSENEALCFCEGWQIANNPEWKFIPHNPAKGEMLIVRFEDELPRDRIYNQSCWVQPIDNDLWRIGATYTWSNFNSEPSPEGTKDLQERLQLLTPIPFKVEDQVAGVRPIVEDYHPVIGRHPEHKNWYVLNAMGSKGVLQAPATAAALADQIISQKSIPQEWCLSRFL
jgi:glycine oxidase